MKDKYFIEPNDIDKLIEVCNTFDNACQECVDNRNNPDFELTRDFGFSFTQLKMFAENNPNFFYQKHLPKRSANIIAYFFSDGILHQERKAQESYLKRIKFYANKY